MNLTGLPPYQKNPQRKLKSRRKDQQFLDWIATQPSAISGRFNDYINGVGVSIACHVRTAGNAGIGYKPLYSAIPMTHDEHMNEHKIPLEKRLELAQYYRDKYFRLFPDMLET